MLSYPTSYLKSKWPRKGLRAGYRRAGLGRHIRPFHRSRLAREQPKGGTIALLRDGDTIDIDIPGRTIGLAVADDELSRRRGELERSRVSSRPSIRNAQGHGRTEGLMPP